MGFLRLLYMSALTQSPFFREPESFMQTAPERRAHKELIFRIEQVRQKPVAPSALNPERLKGLDERTGVSLGESRQDGSHLCY